MNEVAQLVGGVIFAAFFQAIVAPSLVRKLLATFDGAPEAALYLGGSQFGAAWTYLSALMDGMPYNLARWVLTWMVWFPMFYVMGSIFCAGGRPFRERHFALAPTFAFAHGESSEKPSTYNRWVNWMRRPVRRVILRAVVICAAVCLQTVRVAWVGSNDISFFIFMSVLWGGTGIARCCR